MVEQRAQCQVLGVRQAAEPRLLAEPLLQFVVEVEFPLLGKLEHHGGDERLADAAGQQAVAGLEWGLVIDVGEPGCDAGRAAIGQDEPDADAGELGLRPQLVEFGLHPLLELLELLLGERLLCGRVGGQSRERREERPGRRAACGTSPGALSGQDSLAGDWRERFGLPFAGVVGLLRSARNAFVRIAQIRHRGEEK